MCAIDTAEIAYLVPGMSCDHCRAAITTELTRVDGVEAVDVDLDAKTVRVRGSRLRPAELEAAIDDAGYDAQRV